MMTYDAFLIVALVVALPIAVMRPWIGLLLYTLVSTMHPQRLADGLAYGTTFAKPIAAATLLGLLITKERYRMPLRGELVLLALLWLVVTGSTWSAPLQPGRAIAKWEEVTKICLMAGCALVLLQDRRKLRAWLLVLALSIGFYGVTGSLWAAQTGLRERLFGPPESQLADNNALGFAFTLTLPLLGLLRLDERARWLRHVLLAAFGMTIIALFATYSRGAVVGFAIVLPLVAVAAWKRDKALIAVGLAACLVVYFAPSQWVERMQTITPSAYRDDGSGSERMNSWYVAWRLGLDHPLLGAGCHPFSPEIYERYIPGYSDNHDAHNHFLQMLAEHGFVGLILFVALLVSALLRLARLAWTYHGDRERAWIAHTAEMIGISLAAYTAGGVFINQPHAELLYQLVIATVILDVVAALPAADGATPARESLLGAGLRRLRG